MYSKIITVAVVFASTLASSAAVAYPRDVDAQPTSLAESFSDWYSSTPPTSTWKPEEGNNPPRGVSDDGKPTQSSTYTSTSPTGTIVETIRARQNVQCDGIQPWQSNLAYNGGDKVTSNGQLWTAKQWSYNNPPGSAAGEWTSNGACNQPVNNKADCANTPAWNQSVAYQGGTKVTFNGHLWVSTQWAQSNRPGDTSGLWKDLGPC